MVGDALDARRDANSRVGRLANARDADARDETR